VHALVAEAFFGRTFLQVFIFMGVAFLWGFALLELFRSGSRGWVKAVWALVIVCLPIVGSIAYLLVAPTRALDFNPYDKPMSDQQRADIQYEMTHRPIG
jgi:phospholipase D-like protein